MKICERYIHKEHLRILSIYLLSLCALFFVASFLDTVDDALERGVSVHYAAIVSLLKLPCALVELGGISMLASVITLMVLASKNLEVIVLRASGVDVRFILKVLLKHSWILSGILFLNSAFVAPHLLLKAVSIYRGKIKGEEMIRKHSPVNMWIKNEGFICYLGIYRPNRKVIKEIKCYKGDKRKGESTVLMADEAVWKKGWKGKKAKIWTIEGEKARFITKKTEDLHFLPDPERLSDMGKKSSEMDIVELVSIIGTLSKEGISSRTYLIELINRIFLSLFPVLLTIIAFPLGIVNPRRSEITMAFVKGILAGLGSYTLYYAFIFISKRGILHPAVASTASLAIIMFFGIRTIRSTE